MPMQPGLPATRAPRRSRAHRATALLTAATLLAGCVTTREGRIGADNGTDPCRPQLVALDSTGNFFAEDIIRGAAIGAVGGAVLGALVAAASGARGGNIATGAAVGAVGGAVVGGTSAYLSARQQQAQDQASLNRAIAGDLAAENAQIDRTQLAFDQLMDCRFGTAQQIRADHRGGRLTREQAEARMADLRARTQRDIELAQTINAQIARRGGEFDTAIETVAPGTKQQVARAGASISRPVPVQARTAVPLRLRPDPASPEIAQVPARERVTLRPATNGFAQVETASGIRGYAPRSAFPEARRMAAARRAPEPAPSAVASGDVRSLGASNIARRDNFSESLGNAQLLAQGQGFELAG